MQFYLINCYILEPGPVVRPTQGMLIDFYAGYQLFILMAFQTYENIVTLKQNKNFKAQFGQNRCSKRRRITFQLFDQIY